MLKATLLTLFLAFAILAKAQDTCPLSALPSIPFKAGNVFLTPKAKMMLDVIISKMKNAPTCKLRITGHMGKPTYQSQQMSWDRVTSVTNYLAGKGVSSQRWIFQYCNEGDPLIVDVVPTNMNEDGPSSVPVPLPCFSFHHKGKRCVDKHGHFKG